MNILVIGGGGREHAIIKKIKENKDVEKIYCSPGNGGIALDAICTGIKATDIQGHVDFARNNNIDFVIVTPDDPLALGAVDLLQEAGFKCFGPNKNAAIIEASKSFSKELMKKYHIPTADYECFNNADDAINYLENQKYPIVIKADGLALGKGVIIASDKKEAIEAVKDMMLDNKFGAAGNTIIIEEYLEGPEVSVLSFTDGKTLIPMISSMDHKRAYDNDEGLNTGGMGAIAPNPYYNQKVAKEALDTILIPTIEAMNNEGRTFKGCLYFSLMLTKDGPKVIEYNCRFGDPETQVVLPLLDSDLLTILQACSDGNLSEDLVKFSDKSSCCVVMASKGYPETYEKGNPIYLNDEAISHCDFAGVEIINNQYTNSGGRVLGITCVNDNLNDAINDSYRIIDTIDFKEGYYRKDIGKKALEAING